jgi:predicted Fe-Mo cluster-binding NifX family protein
MKIALTIDEPSKDSVIAKLFGRSKFFWYFDKQTSIEEIRANPYAATFGGAGIQAAQLMIEKGVDVVITSQVGENAARILNAGGIKIYYAQAGEKNANFILYRFLAGELEIIKSMKSVK